jgi:hypothetical protein
MSSIALDNLDQKEISLDLLVIRRITGGYLPV